MVAEAREGSSPRRSRSALKRQAARAAAEAAGGPGDDWAIRREAVLAAWAAELALRQVYLTRDGCWQFLHENLDQARALGLEGPLRDLVVSAAEGFFERAMLRPQARGAAPDRR